MVNDASQSLLQEHLAQCERVLLALGEVLNNASHPTIKGNAREIFVRQFLEAHIGAHLGIGTGEIIDCNSQPSERRRQIDVVVYRKDYPRIAYSSDQHAFLAESVAATIEVKSVLTKERLKDAMHAARSVKSLKRSYALSASIGYVRRDILSVVVAYRGPAEIQTVAQWVSELSDEMALDYSAHPTAAEEARDSKARLKLFSPSVDAVFVLGMGYVIHCSAPVVPGTGEEWRQVPGAKWWAIPTDKQALMLLFLNLVEVTSSATLSILDSHAYLANADHPPGYLIQ